MLKTLLPALCCGMACLLSTGLSAQSGLLQHQQVTFGPELTELLANDNRPDEAIRVIATFNSPEQAAEGRKKLQQFGPFVGPEFIKIPMQGFEACPEDLYALTEIDGLIGLWKDRKMKSDLHQAVIVSSVSDVWSDASLAALNDGLTVEGRGVGVLVNDSGFDGMDSDLESTETGGLPRRMIQTVKGTGTQWLEDNGPDNDQGGGHGSHCMGIVGGDGRKSGGLYKGVAPKAHLIGYGSGAGLLILDTGGGFEYVAQNAKNYNIRVMSNSFGASMPPDFNTFDASDPLAVASKTLADMGVIVVFSSGNSGNEDGTITGVYKTSPWVVCVGNGEKNGSLANSSSRGKPDPSGTHPAQRQSVSVGGNSYLWENRPTLVAPGSDIVAVRATSGPGTSTDTSIDPTHLPFYTVKSGTSMACPHVAGVVALMLEANPQLEWRAVKAILQRTAIDMPGNGFHQVGHGFVNAHAAVAAAFHGLLDVPAGSSYEAKYGLPANGDFGFDGEAWQAGTLHSEVASRMKATIPQPPQPVELPCTNGDEVVSDPGTDGGGAFYDVTSVKMSNETATTFDIELEVAGNLLGSPAGVPGGSVHYYDVHFNLMKPSGSASDAAGNATPDQVYIVSAFDLSTVKNFKLTCKTGDGTTRPYTRTSFYEDVTGTWNTTTNTITWTIPKASLNLQTAPADNSATSVAVRTSRGARTGDELGRWRSYVYERVGTTTPDGVGVYTDDASGDCYRNLVVSQ